MREYETVFIVQPEISEEGGKAIFEKLDGVLERSGSHRLLYDDLGKKRLAYEIRKFQKGHYYVLRYLDQGQVVPELERAMRLEESVLRYLTIVVSPEVRDIEARRSEAAEQERIAAEKAAERAAREAEEEKARREAEEVRRAEEAKAAEARAQEEAARAAEAPAAEEAAADASEAPAPAADPAPEAEPAPEAKPAPEAAAKEDKGGES